MPLWTLQETRLILSIWVWVPPFNHKTPLKQDGSTPYSQGLSIHTVIHCVATRGATTPRRSELNLMLAGISHLPANTQQSKQNWSRRTELVTIHLPGPPFLRRSQLHASEVVFSNTAAASQNHHSSTVSFLGGQQCHGRKCYVATSHK